MAERRMFTKKVTDDDNFMALSSSAQALYLHLMMSADDDGFSNQVGISMFKAHASTQDLQALLEKRYIYHFENGVIVIKHFRMSNALRKDRYTPTAFQEELKMLDIKDNGAYTMLPKNDGCQAVANCLPNGCQMDAVDKYSIGKYSIVEDSIIDNQNKNKVYGICNNVNLSDEEFEKLKKTFPRDYEYRINRLSTYMSEHNKTYKNHYATIVMWAERDKAQAKGNTQKHFDNEREYSDADLDEILNRDKEN